MQRMTGAPAGSALIGLHRGFSTFEACVAMTLLGLNAMLVLAAAAEARREATLAAMRQTAVALAEERAESITIPDGPDDASWSTRVSAALPGGSGNLSQRDDVATVEVRWRAPGVSDGRCPGLVCVALDGTR
jgi:hypothetical protein